MSIKFLAEKSELKGKLCDTPGHSPTRPARYYVPLHINNDSPFVKSVVLWLCEDCWQRFVVDIRHLVKRYGNKIF